MRIKPNYKNILILIIMIMLITFVMYDYIRIIKGYQFTLFGLITNIIMIATIIKINSYINIYTTKKELKRNISHQAK